MLNFWPRSGAHSRPLTSAVSEDRFLASVQKPTTRLDRPRQVEAGVW